MVGRVEDAAYPAKKRHRKVSIKKAAALLLVAVIITAAISVWAFDRIETHKRWVKMVNESFDYANNMVLTIPLIDSYYNTPEEPQRFALNSQLWAASLSLRELKNTEQDSNSDLALEKIGSFMSSLQIENLTKLSPTEKTELCNAIARMSGNVANAYMSICNYTNAGDSGIPFWYAGPSSPNQTYLQRAANEAVNAQQIINKDQ
ncbi:MAG: hypothetical protein ACQCN3_03715 [Candidatus Bathyarchaeia archaeon]|jgi:hypothetical protein